jgi:hypothetical protein
MERIRLGTNIEGTIDGDLLTLVIDLSKTMGPSRSGKTQLIASTSGNAIVGACRIGVNVYRPQAGPSMTNGASHSPNGG